MVGVDEQPVGQRLDPLADPCELRGDPGRGVVTVAVQRQTQLEHLARRVPLDEGTRRPLGRDAPLVHDDEAVAQLLGLVHVVRRDDEGDALPLEPEEPVPQDVPRLGVQAGGRLVEQEQLGAVDERPGDRQPSLHAAGERLDPVLAPLHELGEVEQLVGPLTDEAARHAEEPAVGVEVLLDGQLLVEVVLLGTAAEAGADRRAVGIGVEAEDAQLATRARRGRGDHLHRRGLAGAVRPEEAEGLPLRHVDVDAADRDEVAEGLRQPAGTEEDLGVGGRRHEG